MHSITTAIADLRAAVKSVTDANPIFLPTSEKAEALISLLQLETQVAELRLRVMAAAGDVAEETGARHIGTWLAAHGILNPAAGHGQLHLAQALETRPLVRAGLVDGRFTLEHARVILKALEAMPDTVPDEVVARAEGDLCRYAAEFQPKELARLGDGVLARVAPELADEADAKAIQRLEEQAAAKSTLTISDHGNGLTRIHALVPTAVGERLRTMIEAYTQPRIAALEADGKVRPRNRIMADAFAQLLKCVHCDQVPAHGGDATTLIVTVPLDQLRNDLGTAQLGDGTPITAAEARRLACTAAIIPAVLGGRSEPLDLGRSRRLFSPAQRKALRLRDTRCRAEGCTVPATWCDAHHAGQPWSQGGRTNLDDGILLCGHHHRRAHDPVYETSRLPNGDYRYHRRR
jgi:hypothetical protein